MTRLLVIGAVNWDTTLFVDALPKPGHELRVLRMISGAGGKGANTAVAAARILGSGEAAVIGILGSDEIGDAQISVLRSEGVDVSCLNMQQKVKSGQAFVIVDAKGENMILTHHAANTKVTREFVASKKVIQTMTNSVVVVIIDPPLDAAVELVDRARASGKMIIFSPATLIYSGLSHLEKIMLEADYVVVNEHEAMLLADVGNGEEACKKLSTILQGRPVITSLGGRGCAICARGENETIPGIDPSLFGLKVVNTVGAGDALVGAFASFKVLGMPDKLAIFLANIAAALKVTSEETRGSPTHKEILRVAESEALSKTYNRLRADSARPTGIG